jgi:hypothetical protein
MQTIERVTTEAEGWTLSPPWSASGGQEERHPAGTRWGGGLEVVEISRQGETMVMREQTAASNGRDEDRVS